MSVGISSCVVTALDSLHLYVFAYLLTCVSQNKDSLSVEFEFESIGILMLKELYLNAGQIPVCLNGLHLIKVALSCLMLANILVPNIGASWLTLASLLSE